MATDEEILFEQDVEPKTKENKITTLRFNYRFFNIVMRRLEGGFFIDRTMLYKAFHIIKGSKEMELSKEFMVLSENLKKYRRVEVVNGAVDKWLYLLNMQKGWVILMFRWLSTCLRTTNRLKKSSSTRTFPWIKCLNCVIPWLRSLLKFS